MIGYPAYMNCTITLQHVGHLRAQEAYIRLKNKTSLTYFCGGKLNRTLNHFTAHTLEGSRVQHCGRPVAQARRRVVRPILEIALWLPKALTKEV